MVKKWHNFAVKKLSALFRGITSCFHSFRTENKLKKHKHLCKNYDYHYAEISKEDNKY